MKKRILEKTIIAAVFLLLSCITSIEARTFKVASYNVENLFDLTTNRTEYPEYIPNGGHGWTKEIADIKYANIAGVIKDVGADVVALQEVESEAAIVSLRDILREIGEDYPYIGIAGSKPTTVKCAVLSKFPIVKKKEIRIHEKWARNIFQVTLDIDGGHLILFINHWKSKNGPESMRIVHAKALRKEIDRLREDADFIVIGDLNSNYNEYETFRNIDRLNDTNGITGINHILMTIKGSKMVDEEILTRQTGSRYLYNLWLEIEKGDRWSYIFSGKGESPDNIIVSKGLYDNRGISYVDDSFGRFTAGYLFKGDNIYRWQIPEYGKGRHLGRGYSDHLPIFAYFSTEPFR